MDNQNQFVKQNDADVSFNPVILTCGRFEAGQAEAFCRAIEDEARSELALAELAYYRGDVKTAAKAFKDLTTSQDDQVMMSAMLCMSVCALSGGEMNDLIHLLETAEKFSKILKKDERLKKLCDLFLLYFNIRLHNAKKIQLPSFGVNAFNVPEDLMPMAFYIYAHYLIELGDAGRAIGMAEGALLFMKRPSPISEIYLGLIISIGYMLRQIWDKAEYYFRYAWNLAKDDGFLMPFVEHRGQLSGMLEKCLRYEEPAAYKKISELSNVYQKRWIFLHNYLTGDRISDSLTSIEFNIASLASKGLSNGEIADFLGITVNSVRAHLRNIFNKLGINSRKELKVYVI